VAFFLSLAIIALYALPIVTNISATGLFGITMWVAVGAGITALTSLVFYFITPNKQGYALALIVYLLLLVTTGLLVVQSGGIHSPFIALWMLLAFFSGIFSLWGALPVLIATGVFAAVGYLADSAASAGLFATVIFVSIVPMVLGMIIWRDRGEEDAETKDVKNLASKLSEVANKSEIVINAIGDGVMAIDSQGVIQLINPAAQELLGWGKQDALALNYKSVLPMLDAANKELTPASDPIQQVLNTNQQTRANNLTVTTKSGKKITAALVVSPVGDAGGGVIAVFRDVTKEKAEEREQAEFISTASHEMRTPVASIEGYLGLALNPNTAQIDPKAREFIMKAHESAEHLGHLFQDLLDVSKTEDGRLSNTPKVVDMSVYTATIVQGLAQKAQEKNLRLIFKPMESSGQKQIAPVFFINQDNDHVREVLDNLIENAIKYTPAGDVTIDINGTDDKVVVSVKDTGLGIPAEDIPHLFQKFYRIDNADRQDIGGTGLGLYLSRRLSESMGGRLWVESIYKQGSTFFFELPRITSQEAADLKTQQDRAAAQAATAAPVPISGAAAIEIPTLNMASPAGIAVASNSETQSEVQAQSAETVSEIDASGRSAVKPATTVPRGESLTREQIAEHVRQLETIARERNTPPARSAEPVPQRPTTPPAGPPQA